MSRRDNSYAKRNSRRSQFMSAGQFIQKETSSASFLGTFPMLSAGEGIWILASGGFSPFGWRSWLRSRLMRELSCAKRNSRRSQFMCEAQFMAQPIHVRRTIHTATTLPSAIRLPPSLTRAGQGAKRFERPLSVGSDPSARSAGTIPQSPVGDSPLYTRGPRREVSCDRNRELKSMVSGRRRLRRRAICLCNEVDERRAATMFRDRCHRQVTEG